MFVFEVHSVVCLIRHEVGLKWFCSDLDLIGNGLLSTMVAYFYLELFLTRLLIAICQKKNSDKHELTRTLQ